MIQFYVFHSICVLKCNLRVTAVLVCVCMANILYYKLRFQGRCHCGALVPATAGDNKNKLTQNCIKLCRSPE